MTQTDIKLQAIELLSKLPKTGKQRIIYAVSPQEKGWIVDYIMGNTDNPRALVSSSHSARMKAIQNIFKLSSGRNSFLIIIETEK